MDFVARKIRIISRLIALLSVFAFAGIEFVVRRGSRWSHARRAQWLHEWSRVLLRRIGFSVRMLGVPPVSGFLAPNHLGYMDVPVIAALCPMVFLSKSEVEKWPVVGWFVKMAGTLFIDRNRRSDVANKRDAFERVMDDGVGLTIFLEGKSSNGEAVLPFHSSLLQPAIDHGWEVTPAYISYDAVGGDAANEVCWWGDAPFAGHLIGMLGLESVRASVVFGEQRQPLADRKQLADELKGDVLELRKGESNRGYRGQQQQVFTVV